ncbi:D-alanine--D-alanine ligase [bacterium]|nr:D-alanine--D-alanine ligase [bacterium]
MNTASPKRVAVLFGGRSAEHEVSLASAAGVLQHIDRNRFQVVAVKVTREGEWLLLEELSAPLTAEALERATGKTLLVGGPEAGGFIPVDESGRSGAAVAVDAVLPLLHGTFGEDGTLQGLLAMAGIPCAGAGVASSALSMDKVLMKQIFFQNNLPGADYIWFTRSAWMENRKRILVGIADEIGFPCFVKPANGGSSVGISKAAIPGKLPAAVETAAAYDRKILVEKAIQGRELECAVLGNDHPEASVVGEILPGNEFYDYEAKYVTESGLVIPAVISDDVAGRVRAMAVAAFTAVDCAGLGRVDFLYDEAADRLYVNEINTLPGFTPISMYPKLWEASGIPFSRLITRLVELALERHAEIAGTRYSLQ